MKLKTILKTAAFATATMFFLGCSESSDSPTKPGTPKPATGTIEFAILGEDIPYDNLTGDDRYVYMKSATITEAYMLVKAPTLHKPAARHAGENLPGMFAVDLMAKDAERTPVHLGYVEDVDTGSYEDHPMITMYVPAANDWAEVKGDATAKSELQAHGLSFIFRGTMSEKDGTTYNFEIRENLDAPIEVHEYPTAENGEDGDLLYVNGGDTLLAEFHPHIDHALEVFAIENKFDMTQFTTTTIGGKEVIVFSDTENIKGTNSKGEEVRIYDAIVGHINRGDHWDVNVNP